MSSSDYNSDVSLSDHSPRARALVTCQYKRKHHSEVNRHDKLRSPTFDICDVLQISLDVNTLVTVLKAAPNNNWWRVQTEHGLAGFYPANYLRQI